MYGMPHEIPVVREAPPVPRDLGDCRRLLKNQTQAVRSHAFALLRIRDDKPLRGEISRIFAEFVLRQKGGIDDRLFHDRETGQPRPDAYFLARFCRDIANAVQAALNDVRAPRDAPGGPLPERRPPTAAETHGKLNPGLRRRLRDAHQANVPHELDRE